ncbi:MAG: DUF4397 domain-containing protein [Pseudomonadota bacterium]
MKTLLATLALGLATAFMPQQAAASATIYVGHGVNGEDLGLPSELPVDVAVDGGCLLTGVPFGTISDPVEGLDPGPYEVEISLSDGACGGALVMTSRVDLAFGETATVIAHLDQNMTLKISKFTNKVAAPGRKHSRLTVHHLAAAPEVLVKLKRFSSGKISLIRGLTNGSQSFPAVVRDGGYRLAIFPAGTTKPRHALFRTNLHLDGNTSYFGYAVGSAENGLTVLVLAVPG